jgi:hypothetical protein
MALTVRAQATRPAQAGRKAAVKPAKVANVKLASAGVAAIAAAAAVVAPVSGRVESWGWLRCTSGLAGPCGGSWTIKHTEAVAVLGCAATEGLCELSWA